MVPALRDEKIGLKGWGRHDSRQVSFLNSHLFFVATLMSSNDTDGLVLVVDDQPRNLGLVKAALTRDGFEVVTAENAQDALRWLAERTPDLILLDVMMPDMDGFQLCERIKESPATHDIPVIFLSGDDNHGSIRTGFKSGGVDYVTKPFNKEELLARVRTHVELRRAHQRHAEQLIERNRMLKLIANEWHQPLQRLVLTTGKMKELCQDMDEDMASVLAGETTSAERMLASIETFLQMRSVAGDDEGAENNNDSFTSDDLSRMLGRWYATAKRKPVQIVLKDSARGAPLPDVYFMARQIVDAVLANAIAYTPAGGRVQVLIFRDSAKVVVQVSDSGPGFPKDYVKRPFQPYLKTGRLRKQNGQRPSTPAALGIGLAAAKRAADRIGATLTISNEPESGARVRITLPILKKASVQQHPTTPAVIAPPARVKVEKAEKV